MATLHVLRVFCSAEGDFGNPLGVFLDGSDVAPERRQEVAADLNYSETVFVDERGEGRLEIYTPAAPIPFAGHPLVGTGWLLARDDGACERLRPPPGEVPLRHADGRTHITAPASWAPDFRLDQLGSPGEVDALSAADFSDDTYVWAWIDEAAGLVRARSFVPNFGIPEDEATGSAALALCGSLGRGVEVRQGHGSVIEARPLGDGLVEVGGRVVADETRTYDV